MVSLQEWMGQPALLLLDLQSETQQSPLPAKTLRFGMDSIDSGMLGHKELYEIDAGTLDKPCCLIRFFISNKTCVFIIFESMIISSKLNCRDDWH